MFGFIEGNDACRIISKFLTFGKAYRPVKVINNRVLKAFTAVNSLNSNNIGIGFTSQSVAVVALFLLRVEPPVSKCSPSVTAAVEVIGVLAGSR